MKRRAKHHINDTWPQNNMVDYQGQNRGRILFQGRSKSQLWHNVWRSCRMISCLFVHSLHLPLHLFSAGLYLSLHLTKGKGANTLHGYTLANTHPILFPKLTYNSWYCITRVAVDHTHFLPAPVWLVPVGAYRIK